MCIRDRCIAHDIQYHLVIFGAAMYAPCARNSFASWCSTKLKREVTFFALSFGTVAAQLTHWIVPDAPLPPFRLPLLARFDGMLEIQIFDI